MQRSVTCFAAVVGLIVLIVPFSRAEPNPPSVGGVLPEFTLPVPQSSDLQRYLGVAGKNSFAIPEIKAEVVIIEIFSMY